jgi:hypothetical protein
LSAEPVGSVNDRGPRDEAHAAVLSLFDKALAEQDFLASTGAFPEDAIP